MFIRKRPQPIERQRYVVIGIKTTNEHNYDPAAGDRMTQLSCVEMINGRATGNEFYIHLDDPAKNKLTSHQAAFFDFLGDSAETRLLVHFKKYVLDFLRYEMDDQGREKLRSFEMDNMISNAAELSHRKLYFAGKYPDKIETNRERILQERPRYTLEEICKELKVSVRNRNVHSALCDAQLIAKAETNRLQLLQDQNKAQKTEQNSSSRRP